MPDFRESLRPLLAITCILAAIVWFGWGRLGPAVPVPEPLDHFDPEVAALIERATGALRWQRGNDVLRRELGLIYEANDLPRFARTCYAQVLQRQPDDAMTWYRYGHVCLLLGDLPAAIDAMGRVAKLDPTVASAWAQRGLWRLDAGDEERAEEDFQRALKVDPGNEAASFGQVLLALSRHRPHEAVDRLNEAKLFDRSNGHYAYALLGRAYRELGDFEEAEAALARSGGLRPDWTDHWASEVERFKVGARNRRATADSLMKAGRYEQALPLLREAAEVEGDNLRTRNMLAICLREAGEDEACLELLSEMLAKAPEDFWTNVNMADTVWLLAAEKPMDLEKALAHADRAVAARPQSGEAHRVKGRILIALDRPAEAVEVLKRAFHLDARDPSVLVQAGFLECDLERWGDARTTLEEALRYEQRSATPLIGLALAHLGQGDLDSAETLLEQARTRRIDHPRQLERLERAVAAARGGGMG